MVVTGILAAYALASAATFVAYGLDKRRAVRGGRRVRERTLHWMELAGGWPGALAGQVVFRHKWRKGAFMAVFGAIALGHLAGWAAYLGR
jgi:uncharacterized membrane protein YsdA (DUF1294 family)